MPNTTNGVPYVSSSDYVSNYPTVSQSLANVIDPIVVGATRVCTSGTRPASPSHGTRIYETDTRKVYVYTGSAWTEETGYRTAAAGVVNTDVIPPMVRAVRSGDLTYTSDTDIAWNGTDAYDTDSMHDPSTNNTRITPSVAGIYLVQFSAFINISGTATAILPSIRQGSSAVVVVRQDYFSSVSGLMFVNAIGHATVASSSDYLTARIAFSGGSGYTVKADAATYFTATYLGRSS